MIRMQEIQEQYECSPDNTMITNASNQKILRFLAESRGIATGQEVYDPVNCKSKNRCNWAIS